MNTAVLLAFVATVEIHFAPREMNVSTLRRYPVANDISAHDDLQCAGAINAWSDDSHLVSYSRWLP